MLGTLDLKPALTREQLDRRLLREFEEGTNKQFKNIINSWFPAKLYPVMLELGGSPRRKKFMRLQEKREMLSLRR